MSTEKICVIDSDSEIHTATAALITYHFENIPTTLAEITKFVGWQFQYHDGRIRKVPVDIHTLRRIDISDSAHHFSLQDAITAYQGRKLSGIGFVLDNTNNIVAVDIDHCIDETGNLSDFAQEIVQICNSYTEISPSGKGLHIFFSDNDFDNFSGRKNSDLGLEVYTNKRYLTVTGVLPDDTKRNIVERNGLTRQLVETYFDNKPPQKEKASKPLSDFVPNVDDNTDVACIIAKIRTSKQGNFFLRTFR